MGLVNAVVPVADLERETVRWCREMLALSPFALRLMKASFHAAEDGYLGIQQLAHDANLLFYGSEEAKEGREAFTSIFTTANFPGATTTQLSNAAKSLRGCEWAASLPLHRAWR